MLLQSLGWRVCTLRVVSVVPGAEFHRLNDDEKSREEGLGFTAHSGSNYPKNMHSPFQHLNITP